MPLTADDFVQENTGSVTTGTSIVVSLPSGTTAGNTVFVFIHLGQSTAMSAIPTGFTSDSATVNGVRAYHKSDVAAAETSWTFTALASGEAAWYAAEVSNVDAVEPLDATASNSGSISNGSTLSTGTTPLNAGLSTVAFAVYASYTASGGGGANSWSGYTNGFEELADVRSSTAGAAGQLAVARTFLDGTTGTFESTATYAGTGTGALGFAVMLVYRAADAPVAAPLTLFAGFEWGTHGGMGTGGATSLLQGQVSGLGTWGTNYLVQSGSARNGGYGLRIAASAATSYRLMGNFAYPAAAFGFNVRVVSATGTPVVAELWTNDPGGITLQLVYDVATTRFGLKWSTGSVSYQSGTTALNTWVWVDFRLRMSTATWHADWRLETTASTYTDQTSPADLTASPGVQANALRLGADAVQTMSLDFDDVVISRYYVAYPLGPHTVRLLKVDAAGTPTVSGTTTNFSVFTANGTLAAWNATNARNALDEVPPTVSAAADGVVQTAVAASDYMQFPMETYTCSATEIIAAVRMLAPLWSGAGAGAGDLAIRGYDGTTETALATVSQVTPGSLTAASATYPVWRTAMWPSGVGWTQAELDAAALRVGFSGDATPDMGVSALYLEVATRPAMIARQLSVEDDVFTADVALNPYNSASVSYLLESTDATRGATFSYSVSGTPQTPVYVAAASTATVQVNAASFGEISDVSLEPDPI